LERSTSLAKRILAGDIFGKSRQQIQRHSRSRATTKEDLLGGLANRREIAMGVTCTKQKRLASLQALNLLVAGTGFEPVTFGL